MHLLKLICLTFVLLVKQAWLLPQSAAAAFRQKRMKTARCELEAERLDRIRNPWRYVGK